MKKIGIDIGGTAIKIGFFADENLLECKSYADINSLADFKQLLLHADITNFIDEQFIGIGVGVPGVVSGNSVQSCPNIHWLENTNLVALLTEAHGETYKYAVDNDANVAALGEAINGAGSEYPSFAFITIGTGIGGGLIFDRQIFHGPGGMAGEIGHINTGHQLNCNCGAVGCVEAIASASNIERRANGMPLPDVIKSAKSGAEFESQLIKESGEALGEAIAQIALLTDIRVFIFGGGGAPCLEVWLTYINEVIDQRCFGRTADDFVIIQAALGNQAGVYGAAALLL